MPGSVQVDILDEVGDETSSAVRFNFRARKPNGLPYHVEYTLFCKTVGGKVCDMATLAKGFEVLNRSL